MRVLIVRLSSFGDVVHTFPALSDLSAAHPEVEIDWLVDKSFAAIARLHPAISEIIPIAERRDRWPPNRWPTYVKARRQLRRQLQERRYDLVIDLQGLLKSASVARLAAAPIAGYDAKSIREPVASRFYARKFSVARDLHAIERNRTLLAGALDYAVPTAPGTFGLAGDNLQAPAGLSEPFCILFHSASWPSKHWSEDNWRHLVEYLAKHQLDVALPWGSDKEKARALRIAASSDRAHVLPDRLEGPDLAAVIGKAHCAIGLDSGLMHFATALGVPGVWLFGPTDPGLTGPYGDAQIIIQSTSPNAPCKTRDCGHGPDGGTCMDLVDLERVTAALDSLMGRASA